MNAPCMPKPRSKACIKGSLGKVTTSRSHLVSFILGLLYGETEIWAIIL